jgi:hypothetical protein
VDEGRTVPASHKDTGSVGGVDDEGHGVA